MERLAVKVLYICLHVGEQNVRFRYGIRRWYLFCCCCYRYDMLKTSFVISVLKICKEIEIITCLCNNIYINVYM